MTIKTMDLKEMGTCPRNLTLGEEKGTMVGAGGVVVSLKGISRGSNNLSNHLTE